MNNLIASSIPNLSDDLLIDLVKDCEARIGSHVAGGDPNEAYVEQQREIISLVQEEFAKRR